MMRRIDFLRETGARRVDDQHVGAARALEQLGQRQAHVAGEEAGVTDLVALRGGDRVGDRLLHQLDAPQLARPRERA